MHLNELKLISFTPSKAKEVLVKDLPLIYVFIIEYLTLGDFFFVRFL